MRFGDHQPTLTGPMEGHCELDLTIKPSGGADVGRTHLDYAQFPRQGIEFTCQSHHTQYDNESNMIVGSALFNGSAVSKIDANLIDVRSDAYKFRRVSEMSHSTGNADYPKSQLGMTITQIREKTVSHHLAGSSRPEAKASKKGNANEMNPKALQFGHGIGDGSFLRLGIGGGIGGRLETRSNSNFSAREVSSKLEEANSSPHHNYHAQKNAGYHLNLAQSTDRVARLQFNGGGLSNVVSRTSTCEGGGLIAGANGFIGSNPSSSSQIPQVNIQSDFSFGANRSSGLRHDQNPLPLPDSRTLMAHPGYAVPSPLELQPTKPTYFTSQPVSVQQQNYSGKSFINVSPESFSTSPIDWQSGNSVRHSQLRKLIPFTGGTQTQISDVAAFPVSVEPHGPSQTGLDSRINHLGHTVPSGQHVRVIPSHLSKGFPKGHSDPAAQLVAQPQAFPIPHRSLKRGAIENSTTTQRPNHRRKIIHGPYGSVSHQRKWSPAPVPIPAQIPSAPFHIKFEGFDRPPKPCGYNCFLCKRDLSFTAEGSVYQPTAPPAVAVLPCGHLFHDSCLQIITPEDQSKHPTCIPCATGGT